MLQYGGERGQQLLESNDGLMALPASIWDSSDDQKIIECLKRKIFTFLTRLVRPLQPLKGLPSFPQSVKLEILFSQSVFYLLRLLGCTLVFPELVFRGCLQTNLVYIPCALQSTEQYIRYLHQKPVASVSSFLNSLPQLFLTFCFIW